MIDTHAHLNISEYENDIDDVIKRAINNNVNNIIVIGMDYKTSLKAIELAEKYSNLYATVGLHPSYVNDEPDISYIEKLINHPKVVAIGETGLDYYWTIENKDLQIKRFNEQIKLAIKHNKPIVIHSRNSFIDCYEMIKPYKGLIKGVFHCFSGNLDDAKKAIDLGLYIGIDGPITFKKNDVLVSILKNIDLSQVLIETDSPYLAPTPYRGKRNEPAYVKHVLEKIAEIKNIDLKIVEEITTKNAKELFSIGDET